MAIHRRVRIFLCANRVDYGGHSFVTSSGTRFSEILVAAARGTDCLIHSAWSVSEANPTPPAQRSIAAAEDAPRVFPLVAPRLGA